MAPGIFGPAGHRFPDDDPGIVVTEDAGVLLVSLGIGADLTVLLQISRVGGRIEHQSVFTFQILDG